MKGWDEADWDRRDPSPSMVLLGRFGCGRKAVGTGPIALLGRGRRADREGGHRFAGNAITRTEAVGVTFGAGGDGPGGGKAAAGADGLSIVHHATIFMAEDVAMVDEAAGELLGHIEDDGFAPGIFGVVRIGVRRGGGGLHLTGIGGYGDGQNIAPNGEFVGSMVSGIPIRLELELERILVNVERVSYAVAIVPEGPLFGDVDGEGFSGARWIVLGLVDPELRTCLRAAAGEVALAHHFIIDGTLQGGGGNGRNVAKKGGHNRELRLGWKGHGLRRVFDDESK